jgi:uncharacterized protein YjiK
VLASTFLECNSKRINTPHQPSTHSVPDNTHVLYDLSKPAQVWNLPISLKEVSGNAWVDENHLLMIEDLDPELLLVRLEKEGVVEKTIPFVQASDKKFDVEDVALAGTTAYALWSHGVIYQISNWNNKPTVRRWETGLTKKNNTEGLCLDPVSHGLFIACKDKSGVEDEKKSTRAVYKFALPSGKLLDKPFLLLHKKDFKKNQKMAFNFYPSAIAVHPQTHDLYMLSSRETKAMAIYSYDGKLKAFEYIDKELMPQPEGLCFSPLGDLYISTEGKHGKPAKVLKFRALK